MRRRRTLGQLSEAIRAALVDIQRAPDERREAEAIDWLQDSISEVVHLYGLEALDGLNIKAPLAELTALQRAKATF